MAKHIKKYRPPPGLTTHRCPVCRREHLVARGRFEPHWAEYGTRACPGSGKSAEHKLKTGV